MTNATFFPHGMLCGPAWSLKTFLPIWAPYSPWLKFNMHNFHTRASYHLARRSPVDSHTDPYRSHTGPQVYGPHLAFKIILQALCRPLKDSLWCLEICMGMACAVLTGFAYGCCKPRIASTRAHKTSARAPYGTHRGTHKFMWSVA